MLKLVLILVGLVALSHCQTSLPDTIVLNITNLIPEGIEWHPTQNQFILSSGSGGPISLVSDSGVLTTLVPSPGLAGSFGLLADETRDLLYIANNNLSMIALFGGRYISGLLSSLIVASLSNGTILEQYDFTNLPNANTTTMLANDVAIDDAGIVYTTDSVLGAVYRTNRTANATTIWQTLPEWFLAGPALLNSSISLASGLSLNGIKFIDGALVTCLTGNGKFYKIPINGSTPTVITGVNITGCDGMRVTKRTPATLIVDNAAFTYELSSSDNWASASIIKTQATVFGGVSTSCLRPTSATVDVIYLTNNNGGTGFASPYEIEKSFSIDSAISASSSSSSSNQGTASSSSDGGGDGSSASTLHNYIHLLL